MPTLSETTMERLLKARAYPKPRTGEVYIFGLRSFSPVAQGGTNVKKTVEIAESDLDYRHVRCTIGLWKVGSGVAVFPGSTVPRGSVVAHHSSDPWGKVNQMVPGAYASYKLGEHGGSLPHRAIRQVRPVVVRRSADHDAVFELTDPIYVDGAGYQQNGQTLAEGGLVYNNIHCGHYFNGENLIPSTSYSSAGCQVVAGHTDGSANSEAGPWRKFIRKLYNDNDFNQNNYTYLLFSPEEVRTALSPNWGTDSVEVTFGSYSESAKVVQQALQERGLYSGDIDGDFRTRSVSALLAFERSMTSDGGASGRTTPVVQDLLEIELPVAEDIELVSFGSLAVSEAPVVPALAESVADVLSVDPSPPESSTEFSYADPEEGLSEDATLLARLDTNHKPLPGWRIKQQGNSQRWELFHDEETDGLYLGYEFGYPKNNPTTLGLARISGASPKLRFDPEEWEGDFGSWSELLYPTSWAESNANFLVVNAWDRAAITVGFIQLAAHTPDDFLPFMKRIVRELPHEAQIWFPELVVVQDELCFRQNGRLKSLEKARRPDDGVGSSSWYRGDFMQFFNPNRRRTDPEELHACARWVEWTRRSRDMRRIQVQASIENMKHSLMVLHRALLNTSSSSYPRGVDGMRCDHLAAALAVPHLNPGKVGQAVWALNQNNILAAFANMEYGPGEREQTVVDGVLSRGERLSDLRYNLAHDAPE